MLQKKVKYIIFFIIIVIILTSAGIFFLLLNDKLSYSAINDVALSKNNMNNNISKPHKDNNIFHKTNIKLTPTNQVTNNSSKNINNFDDIADVNVQVIPIKDTNNNICFNLHIKSSYQIMALDLKISKLECQSLNITSTNFSVKVFKDKVSLLRDLNDKTLDTKINTDLDMAKLCVSQIDESKVLNILDASRFVFFEYGTGEALNAKVIFGN